MATIRLFGKPWCEETVKLRRLLNLNGIEYTYEDVNNPQDLPEMLTNRAEVKINRGVITTPILTIDGGIYSAPGMAVLRRVLDISVEPDKDYYDALVIGGGLTGLFAALNLSIKGLKSLVLESADLGGVARKNENVIMHAYHGVSVKTDDFLTKIQDQILSLGSKIVLAANVARIGKQGDSFIISTSNKDYYTRTIIIAVGMQKQKLVVVNHDKYIGTHVFYNPPFAPTKWRGKVTGVFGDTRAALYFSNLLSRITTSNYLFLPSEAPDKEMLYNELNSSIQTSIYENCTSLELAGTDKLEEVRLQQNGKYTESIMPFDNLFIIPDNLNSGATSFIKNSAKLDDRGLIFTKENYEVEGMPGVFAAGECRHREFYEQLDPQAEGAIAANFAYKYLRSL